MLKSGRCLCSTTKVSQKNQITKISEAAYSIEYGSRVQSANLRTFSTPGGATRVAHAGKKINVPLTEDDKQFPPPQLPP